VTLILRHIKWPADAKPSDKPDFHVMENDVVVGRMYLKGVPGGVKWFWSINGLAIRDEHVPNGLAASRDQAMAAFEAAWEKAEKR
jgi:hypothetical protein